MSAGMSVERLKRLDAFLAESYVDAGRMTGALTMVARHGEIVHCSAQGLMDVERGKPTTEDTIYRIYSMTKPITSVGLMMLYEEGKFHLNDPVHEYLPEWPELRDSEVWVSGDAPFQTRPAERAMTIRDLLSHQSGLMYGFTDHPLARAYPDDPPMSEVGSLAEWSASMAKMPLLYSPGSAWEYSVATDMCGYLTEVISGKPFPEYLQERILDPLGMSDTAFQVADEDLARFSACYQPNEDGGYRLQDDPETSRYRRVPTVPSGGGGMVSTAGDYMRFCQMLLNGGVLDGERILSRKTIDLMTANHIVDGSSIAERAVTETFQQEPLLGVGFGLGFSVVTDPARYQTAVSPGTYAWGGAASTTFWIDPLEDLICVFMTQMFFAGYPIRNELQAIVYAALDD